MVAQDYKEMRKTLREMSKAISNCEHWEKEYHKASTVTDMDFTKQEMKFNFCKLMSRAENFISFMNKLGTWTDSLEAKEFLELKKITL